MTTILITVEGAVIQNVTADQPNVRVVTKEFDRDEGVLWADAKAEFLPNLIAQEIGEMHRVS